MKNSPDRIPLDELDKRIASYTEMPDDLVWENINAGLRRGRLLGTLSCVDRATTATALLVLLTLFLNNPLGVEMNVAPNEGNLTEKRMRSEKEDSSVANIDKQNEEHLKNNQPQSNESDAGLNNATLINRKLNPKISARNVPGSSFRSVNQRPAVEKPNVNPTAVLEIDSLKVEEIIHSDTLSAAASALESNKRRVFKKFKFYAHVTPMLTFQRVIPTAMDGIIITDFDNASIMAAERFALSLSAGIQGYLSRRFEYYGGLTVYHQRRSLMYAYRSDGVIVETAGELKYVVKPNYSTDVLNYRMLNVGVQGGILYHLYGKRLSHKVGAGLTFVQGINRRGNAEVYENSGSSYLSYQLFYRNEMIVSRRLTFFLQPMFSQSFYVDEKLDAPFKLKPYSAGVGIGILYNLK